MKSNTMTALPLPISTERWAFLWATFPLTVDEWEQLNATLQAMRPGIVESDAAMSRAADRSQDGGETNDV